MDGEATRVRVHALDPILKAGVVSQLCHRSEIRLVDARDAAPVAVALVVTDAVDDDALQLLRQLQRGDGAPRAVLVSSGLDGADLINAIEAGVVGVLRRREAESDRLVDIITSAAQDEGSVPPDLLGDLLRHVGDVQRGLLGPRGLSFNGLADREIEVLRLIADGCDTHEIADRLAYSERTVKSVLHDVTTRLNLRNRAHAVAYAVKQGLI